MVTGSQLSSQLIASSLDIPLLWVSVSYCLGALPFAVWIGALAGRDPRRRGSKNPGASNVARTAGAKWGLLTLLLDATKGAVVPSLILAGMLISAPAESAKLSLDEWAAICGLSAVLGHVTSPLLGFKGGRGVATALGAAMALHVGLATLGLAVWLVTIAITRVPAWASLAMSATLVAMSNVSGVEASVRIFCALAALIIAVRHWRHIERLFTRSARGSEAAQLFITRSGNGGPKRGPKKRRAKSKRR